MATAPTPSSLDMLAHVPDTRHPHGVRHLLPAILSLVFLGILTRIREMAVLQRWAEEHWDELHKRLGFTRHQLPHASTISRALADCDLSAFVQAFLVWLQRVALDASVAEWLTRAAISVRCLLREPYRSLRDQGDRIAWHPHLDLKWLQKKRLCHPSGADTPSTDTKRKDQKGVYDALVVWSCTRMPQAC